MNTYLNKIEHSPIKQIAQIINLLTHSPHKYTITSLSKTLNLPIGLTRNIIKTIANSQDLFQFYIGNEIYNNIDNTDGFYDEYTLSIKSKAFIVDSIELDKYNTILHSYKSNAMPNITSIPECIVKEKYQSFPCISNVQACVIRKLQDAFTENKTLLCKKTDGSSFYPLALYYDSFTSGTFCVSLTEETLIFHPITQIEVTKQLREIYTIYDDVIISTTLNLLKFVWSPHPVSLYAKPTFYRILIKNELNTIEKIRHDISNYNVKFSSESNDRLLLELYIIDSESFISWLLSYGSSITVSEPTNIRNKIIETYKNVIKRNS